MTDALATEFPVRDTSRLRYFSKKLIIKEERSETKLIVGESSTDPEVILCVEYDPLGGGFTGRTVTCLTPEQAIEFARTLVDAARSAMEKR